MKGDTDDVNAEGAKEFWANAIILARHTVLKVVLIVSLLIKKYSNSNLSLTSR